MHEKAIYRVLNVALFALLIGGIYLVFGMDVSATRKTIAFIVLVFGFLACLIANYEDYDKAVEEKANGNNN